MIRIKIFRTIDDVQGWGGDFPTQDEAQAWLDQGITENWWGQPDNYRIEQEDISETLNEQAESYAAKKFLDDTDWLIIRQIDSGEPCPEDVKAARAVARTKVIN